MGRGTHAFSIPYNPGNPAHIPASPFGSRPAQRSRAPGLGDLEGAPRLSVTATPTVTAARALETEQATPRWRDRQAPEPVFRSQSSPRAPPRRLRTSAGDSEVPGSLGPRPRRSLEGTCPGSARRMTGVCRCAAAAPCGASRVPPVPSTARLARCAGTSLSARDPHPGPVRAGPLRPRRRSPGPPRAPTPRRFPALQAPSAAAHPDTDLRRQRPAPVSRRPTRAPQAVTPARARARATAPSAVGPACPRPSRAGGGRGAARGRARRGGGERAARGARRLAHSRAPGGGGCLGVRHSARPSLFLLAAAGRRPRNGPILQSRPPNGAQEGAHSHVWEQSEVRDSGARLPSPRQCVSPFALRDFFFPSYF